MAQRRMFSNKIVSSARFLKMPVSSQLLYFHLGLNADDDGVVEGYNIMRMMNCTEDDLKILVAKGFIIVLNEDLVAFVTDWKEHNLIRADRKIDSIYKDLLIKVVQGIDLKEPRRRADLKPIEIEVTEESGRPVDNQLTTNGQHRLGKVRLGKDRLGKDRLDIEPTKVASSNKLQPIMDSWNNLNLSKIITINGNRLKMLNARIKEYTMEDVLRAIDNINSSSFLKGQNNRNWIVTFDWFIKPNNFIKVLEGNYTDKEDQHGSTGQNNAESKYTGFKPQQPKVTEEFDTTDLI